MRLPLYQVDAFADAVFAGNPAAVVPLEDWLPDATLQAIAAENNLAETAFLVRRGDGYEIRWFTPTVEVDLCGHATLASAFVIATMLEWGCPRIDFATREAGTLSVTRNGDLYTLDFPSRPPEPLAGPPAGLLDALGGPPPTALLKARDLVVVYDDEATVRALTPDMSALARLEDFYAVIVTAPGGGGVDFVSRFFAPAQGIPEDPVTGSAHCTLIPYWARRLGKERLKARQVSARGGSLSCELVGDRVKIAGKAVLYMDGAIYI
ncbi:PhzF family phenazine biosynthesis protein [Azospirillum brasilense]|uniref:PhzF family phenazine biosynthesis protein n=1 Tax=Azospirillum brasilense TaxID=192 RepID=A0A560CCF5_AZOBR|nr:PhzF family phenazine biosynthesis protein [Azospirillum brasilense]TWA82534.1 PhzF family phenazine biosynthesis protein [Azospirillum brasilense]